MVEDRFLQLAQAPCGGLSSPLHLVIQIPCCREQEVNSYLPLAESSGVKMGRKMIVRVEPQFHTVDVNGVNASHLATSLLKVIVLRTLYNSMLLINGRSIMRDTAGSPGEFT